MAELADVKTSAVVWSERIAGDVGDLLQEESELSTSHSIGRAQRRHGQRGAKHAHQAFANVGELLAPAGRDRADASGEHPRFRPRPGSARCAGGAAPPGGAGAGLARQVVHPARGARDERRARQRCPTRHRTDRARIGRRAECTLALAIQGHALCQLSRDIEGAARRIDEAIQLNPNESLAWLYKSVWSSMWGSTEASVQEAETATRLSPIDPMKYYYDMILAAGIVDQWSA